MLHMGAMLSKLAARPVLLALLIGLASAVLFGFHLDRPSRPMFDEVHYLPAARILLALEGPTNIEHPLLGKALIATGIALFGDDVIGWRAMALLAGAATVMAVFAFLQLLTANTRTAVFGAVLVALNQLVFIQARIAMLDVFLGALLLWGLVSLLWAMRSPPRWTAWRWTLGSALLGLAVGVKWLAVPYVAFAGMAFVAIRLHDTSIVKPPSDFWSGKQAHWPGLATVPALLILGLVSIAAYVLTFLPAFFYAEAPLTLADFVPFQREMWALQTQKLAAHPYQSSWWSWPLMLRPIWYFYEPDMGAQRGVLLIGNPVIMWGGLVAVVACWWAGLRHGARRTLAVAALWTASLLVWAIIPKSLGFYYYYYLPGIFLCLVIPVAFERYDTRRRWDDWYAGASLIAFGYFYPILSAAPLSGPGSFAYWMWFDSWR
jgi:dolichyl-phosphate-mannose--protein O-mannosyl transferase